MGLPANTVDRLYPRNCDENVLACSQEISLEYKSSKTVLESLRLFFGSSTARPRSYSRQLSLNNEDTLSNKDNSSAKYSTSGYQSLEESLDFEDSYIKVSKFSETNESDENCHYGTYKEYKEMAFQQTLASEIKELVETQQLHNIKISDYLSLRTAGDIMNLSKYEPYGLKGCKLIIMIEEHDQVINLGCVYPEKGIISTFEITLVLHLKRNPCRRLPFMNCKPNEMVVLEQYELRKEKMYMSKNRRVTPPYKSKGHI